MEADVLTEKVQYKYNSNLVFCKIIIVIWIKSLIIMNILNMIIY